MTKEPGFYPDVSFDEYASWDAVNHSKLVGFKHTPAHARWLFLNEKPPTAATEFGWLAHLAVLEPHRLHKELAVKPAIDGRTKEGRPIQKAFKERCEREGIKVVKKEEMDALQAIARNCFAHETAREYLTGPGWNEVSIVWKDPATGVLCKARLDRIALASKAPNADADGQRHAIVIDLKTLGDEAQLREVERSIYNFNYASAAAMYLEGLNQVLPAEEMRPFVWIVAETAPPNQVRLFTPNADLLEWGHQRWHNWLAQCAECQRTGNWPGWNQGIEEANLPPWASKIWELQQ